MTARARWRRATLVPRAGEELPLEEIAGACLAALLPLGALGTEEQVEHGAPVVIAWLPEDADASSVERALSGAGVACELASFAFVEDPGWVERFNESLVPIDVGRRLTILPRPGPAPAGRIALVIEPGRAFGTGHHESTRLALVALEEAVTQGCTVLDVGTGSGILALAAVRLGAGAACGVDADAEAIEVARGNLEGQPEAPLITLRVASDPARIAGTHDVVLANIQAEVLLRMLPALRRRMAPGGVLILSGLLEQDEAALDAAMRGQGLLVSWRSENEWRCAVGRAAA